MMKLALLFVMVACACANYNYGSRSFETPLAKKFIEIRRLVGSTDNKGNYNFESESADGTKMAEVGGLKIVNGAAGAIKSGESSWTSPEGKSFKLSYTADEFGYHPVGAHLPVAPPMPEAIARMLPTLPKLTEAELGYTNTPSFTAPSSFMVSAPSTFVSKPLMNAPIVNSMFTTAPILSSAPVAILSNEKINLKTHVETPEFVIDSEPSNTFFKIGH